MAAKGSRTKSAETASSETEVQDAPELTVVKDAVTEEKSPYPEGTKLFSYQPKAGGPPVLLPISGFERPDRLWLWSMHRQPFLSQTWAWMDRANVPDSVQIQTQALTDDGEYLDMFTAWVRAMGGGATPGES